MGYLKHHNRRIAPKQTSADSCFNVCIDQLHNRYLPFHPSKFLFSILFSFSITVSSSNVYSKKDSLYDCENSTVEIDASGLDKI